jgi:hypothetical protein
MESIRVDPLREVADLSERESAQIEAAAENIRRARDLGRPVMLTYGAHLIKNGLAPVVVKLIEEGWVTHVATNGAGSIHDWEFSYIGVSTEDVRANTASGRFGTWEETGKYINLSVAVGGMEGLGYGASVGKMIEEDGLEIPSAHDLREMIAADISKGHPCERIGALSDMLYLVTKFDLDSGRLEVKHRYKEYSIQYAAWKARIPFTVHPGIGYDIIYTHPLNCGGAIGRASVWDFLSYAQSVSELTGGVHLSVGSAIMAPMIFEKSLSMANNKSLLENGKPLSDYYLVVVDIQDGGNWDWSKGEPPMENPAYYLRFCKSFYRMGGTLDYVCLDNRRFMTGLYQALSK